MNKRQRKKATKKLKKKIFTGQLKEFTIKPDFKRGVDWTASSSVIDITELTDIASVIIDTEKLYKERIPDD